LADFLNAHLVALDCKIISKNYMLPLRVGSYATPSHNFSLFVPYFWAVKFEFKKSGLKIVYLPNWAAGDYLS